MGTLTLNYNLYKPAEIGEFVDVGSQLNDNYDIIDTELKVNADAATALDTRLDAEEAATIAQAAINTSDDTRLDTLEGIVGTDTGWEVPGTDLVISPGLVNSDSIIRRVGDIVDVHIRVSWNQASVTPNASGNIGDVDICVLGNGGMFDFDPLQANPRIYTGMVNATKYIATFALDPTDRVLRLVQVDSNASGDIVNGDIVGVDFTMTVV